MLLTGGSDGAEGSRGRLRVAVYAIARNEAAFAARFMASVASADEVLIADTGSEDATSDAFRNSGARVFSICVSPWRFDDARNAALALVSAQTDVCISLDCDEVIAPGWRATLERAWSPGTTRLRYTSIYSWTTETKPNVVFLNDRIHARHGYRWRYPIHECVDWSGAGAERTVVCPELEVHHYPDPKKSRSNYLPMLERAALEDPHSPRMAYYLGRERLFAGDHDGAIRELTRYLGLPTATWSAQRGDACRLIARCREAQGAADSALDWRWKCVLECAGQREAWVDLALALYHRSDFAGGYFAAGRALAIDPLSESHFSNPEARGPLPHDLLSNCAWQMGLVAEAKRHALIAAELAPHDARLRENVAFFQNGAADRFKERAPEANVP